MPPSDRGPLHAALALCWTFLLICLLLWGAVWLLSQIWGWLLLIAALIVVPWLLTTWLRARCDRWFR